MLRSNKLERSCLENLQNLYLFSESMGLTLRLLLISILISIRKSGFTWVGSGLTRKYQTRWSRYAGTNTLAY
jgi:hypothetical protein